MSKRTLIDDEIEETKRKLKHLKKIKETRSDESDTEHPGRSLTVDPSPQVKKLSQQTPTSAASDASKSQSQTKTKGSKNKSSSSETPNTFKSTNLTPVVLNALGVGTEDTPTSGYEMHYSIAKQWNDILRKGENRKALKDLLNEYSIPSNCTFLRAPKLNSCLVKVTKAYQTVKRDEWLEDKQEQLGIGISAIANALNMLIYDNVDEKTVDLIKILSAGCGILLDVHWKLSRSRQKIISESDSFREFKNITLNCVRDETLFGVNFEGKGNFKYREDESLRHPEVYERNDYQPNESKRINYSSRQ